MKTIIINGGPGKRMNKLTKNKPKCLVELNKDETILGRQLKILRKNNLEEIIMITGYKGEQIKRYVDTKFPEFKVEYVNNPIYAETNYIYALSLIRDKIDDNIISVHGDMVFDEAPFKRLIYSKYPNAVLMSKELIPAKDFKGKVENGIVIKIGVDVFGDNCYFLVPLYKLSKNKFLLWLDEIDDFLKRGETKVYAENAFNNISSKIGLKPVYFTELCNEVDDERDLKNIKKELYKNETDRIFWIRKHK